MVSELKNASLSQYITLMFGKQFISYAMPLKNNGCTANFENLSTQVKNIFVSVE